MKKSIRVLVALIIMGIFFSGCSMKSENDAINDATTITKEVFHDETTVEPNDELNENPVYIPNNLEVQSGDENNLVLEDGDQTYILFNNAIEETNSELHFSSAKTDDALALESFSDDNLFGYIRILPDEGEGYELQVGVGGVKITTYTTKGKIDNDAEEMMKMAKFISSNQDD
ncbi:hypothetical protein [Oceanobacillus bengalensis]|uniref:Uncharacterized protein n=1 Tax=Oceanobacillus bengalensis TaxID=1435466 RepID=A0A494YY05_9BACI|nr:hypothetical protein [Oceanobacillus bengalensis]RKQ14898.1 hypothetical protein D8M05_11575 [Oceanobacillus bengalensis]